MRSGSAVPRTFWTVSLFLDSSTHQLPYKSLDADIDRERGVELCRCVDGHDDARGCDWMFMRQRMLLAAICSLFVGHNTITMVWPGNVGTISTSRKSDGDLSKRWWAEIAFPWTLQNYSLYDPGALGIGFWHRLLGGSPRYWRSRDRVYFCLSISFLFI